MDVLLRAQDISTRLANRRQSDVADIVLCPALDGRSWLDPSDPLAIIEAGARACRERMAEVRALLSTLDGLRGTSAAR
jgi:hypothetical protein